MNKLVLAAVAAFSVFTATSASALERYSLRLINDTSSTIVAVYVRNLATDELSSDILGSDVIPVGDLRTVRLRDMDGTCHWRIQTDLADGREVRKNLNVCTTVSLTITN